MHIAAVIAASIIFGGLAIDAIQNLEFICQRMPDLPECKAYAEVRGWFNW